MTAHVVDTNVPITANGDASHAPLTCQLACIARLRAIRTSGEIVIDDASLILDEYRRYLSPSGQPGVGDAFFRYLWQVQADPSKCEQVSITPMQDDPGNFAEFPADPNLKDFDYNDRKFVAVAIVSDHNPIIENATDTDWWNARNDLGRHGICVNFLCPDQMCQAE